MFSFFSGRGWDDPDWRVRERAALTMRDRKRLRHLALADVSEEVRVAAVKSLEDEDTLAQVIGEGACDASRKLALARVKDPARRLALVTDGRLPAHLRLAALDPLPPDPRLRACYQPELPVELKIALLQRIADDGFLRDVIAGETEPRVRTAAIGEMKDERLRTELALVESDTGMRRLLIDGVRGPAALRELFANEDDEPTRVWLAGRLDDPAHLAELARGDHNSDVRAAALERVNDTPVLLEIARDDTYEKMALLALARLGTDETRAAVALGSPHEPVRIEAVRRIDQPAILARIEEAAAHPEIRWLAGRKGGTFPVAAVCEIHRGRTLKRLIDQETIPEVAAWLVGHVIDADILGALAGAPQPEVAAAAAMRLRESVGPHGLRLMPVPGRPYELGVFPVTCGQLRALLGAAAVGGEDELPAGVTPEQAGEFCAKLSALDGNRYRLPSFEEWRHACLTDDETWFDATRIRTDAAQELLQTHRVPVAGSGRRPVWRAWPNPWGLLDMVGNVAVWVDDSPVFLARNASLLAADPLAEGGAAGDPAGFAVAAGATWADARVRKGRLERLVARAALAGYAADKVGFRVMRETSGAGRARWMFKLVLLPETAHGVLTADVIESLRGRWVEAQKKAEEWYAVAPTVVLTTADYEEARRFKQILEHCGARVKLSSRVIE